MEQKYYEESPGALGFFTLATPIAAAVDTVMNIPGANGATARLVITATGVAGLQHLIGRGRKIAYHCMGIYDKPESIKRVADFTYGAGIGAILTPAFHTLNEFILPFNNHVSVGDSSASGAIVGGITGLVGWMASDAYSHSWEISNTPSRKIKLPGVARLKALPTKTKKALAIGAALMSFVGTGAYYRYRHHHDMRRDNHYEAPNRIPQKSYSGLEASIYR